MSVVPFIAIIKPLVDGGQPIIATITPLISIISGGAGDCHIMDGYEISAVGIKAQCYPHEMDWLIESGQYRVIKKPAL